MMPVAPDSRQADRQRPAIRTQRPQRKSYRDNPYTGTPWGQAGWPDDTAVTLDLTTEVFEEYPAPFDTLAALAADGTYGDGNLAYNAGANFTAGQYVVLGLNTRAHYDTAAWVAGAAP